MTLIPIKISRRKRGSTSSSGGGAIASPANGFTTGGTVAEAFHAREADKATFATTAQTAQTAAAATHALTADTAHDLDSDTPYTDKMREMFLSRLGDDVAAGVITFEKAARFLDGLVAAGLAQLRQGARFGDFIAGKQGAAIDAGGNGELESLTVRSYLKVMELIYNRLNALEGDFSFSDSGTIEEYLDNGDGRMVAVMRRRWEGDFTAFQPGDVVYGYVNNLTTTGEYYRAWARVDNVDRDNNRLLLTPYRDELVPAGRNFPMTANMIIARWGNEIPATADTHRDYPAFIIDRGNGQYYNTRQSVFYISAEEGNIQQLMGVDAPILRPGCYATVLGRIPDGLLDEKTEELINKYQPYLYARGIVVQDIIRVNYKGVVQRTANYRGTWSATTAASDDPYTITESTYDTVTHRGALWQCRLSGTTEEPTATTTAWLAMTAQEGTHTEERYKFAQEGATPTVIIIKDPYTEAPARNPIGWSLTPPEVTEGMVLWRIQADINPDDTRASDWSAPVRISGWPGADGEPGKDGDSGKDGLLVYPAGEYDPTEIYKEKSGTVPVVLYQNTFYVLSRGAMYCGDQEADSRYNTPAKEYANSPAGTARWTPLEKFNSIFADILMANFAKLGSAVFYGDWMLSQQGRLIDTTTGEITEASTEYQKFPDGSFQPNIALNFATGAGTFAGEVRTFFSDIVESADAGRTSRVSGGYRIKDDFKLMHTSNAITTVWLPTDPKYTGTRVTLCDSRTITNSSTGKPAEGIMLRCVDGTRIYGNTINYAQTTLLGFESMTFCGGVVELLAVPAPGYLPVGQVRGCVWYLLNVAAGVNNYTY